MKNKIFKKTFLIMTVISIIMIFTMGMVSAFSEEIIAGVEYRHITYQNKYYTLEEKYSFDRYYDGIDYLLKLKDSKKDTYKINGARIYYYNYHLPVIARNGHIITDREIKNINIKSKDKSSISIKLLRNPKYGQQIHSVTLTFTKNGKKGTINMVKLKKDTWATNKIYNAITAKIMVREKGYYKYDGHEYFPITKYNNIKINTQSSKYLIKSVKIYYRKIINWDMNQYTFKGNGKTTMTINVPKKYLQFHCEGFRITYY
ncbi:MAG: hypothetical protein LBM96_11075 [Methanobrevibacter sp.]|jgi:hypothetical protein|nr:hypothetical protein [Candidatus Methanoflexus mossambicus]